MRNYTLFSRNFHGKETNMYASSYVWAKVLIHMESLLGGPVISTWFDDAEVVELTEQELVLCSSSDFRKDIIERRCIPYIQDAMRELFQMEVQVKVLLKDELEAYQNRNKKPQFIEYNPQFTFDRFIVGPSNRFAHAAAIAVANKPAEAYNPLFIYGPSGLGKTHLLYAIAGEINMHHPEFNIVYIKGDQFTNELIQSLQEGRNQEFRNKYRNADLFLVDDIQFIAGKDSTQEEFFHTFNNLYDSKKQIVLTSDRPPKEMYTLEERIQTRFSQGIIVDVQPPEYELRLAILRKKAEKGNIVIPNNVIIFLAERLSSNIREIEGALKKIGAVSLISGKPVTLEMVKSSIPDYFRENKPVAETVNTILEVTARKYDVTVENILGKSRTKAIKTARNVSMYVIKKVLDLSLDDIGKMMDRDHSTVHSNIKNIETEIKTDDKLNNEIFEIMTEIKS